MLLNAICRAEKMDNSLPPEITATNVLGWSPHVQSTTVTEPLLNYKILRVEQHIGSQDPLARLKDEWIGLFYVNHLQRIPLVRWLSIRLWRTLYPIYINTFAVYFGSRASKRWRPLVKLGDYVNTLHLPTTKVFDAARVDTPAPKVFPVEDQAYLVSPHDHYVFPPVYVAELGDALIYGGTNLVFAQDAVICHDLYDFERDYTSEELHGRHVIDAKKMRMRLLCHDPTPVKLAVAAAFVDACAHNYAHWLTEVLPRIAVFCSIDQYANIPIIVDDGLHHNIMESLCLITRPEREIITLPVGRAIQADSLYITSVVGYVPFVRRTNKLSGHSQGVFSPSAFEILRNHLNPLGQKATGEDWPEKIFLRRNSGTRKISNAAEIEKLLIAHGYVIVEPEKLTFLQQIKLCRNAKKIVSLTGAALANAIVCKPGTQVTVLMSKHENMIYRYWVNLLNPFGIKVNYVLGNIIDQGFLGIHGDFAVNIADVIELLNTLEDK